MGPCASCGGDVPERARFCPHCGSPQTHEDSGGITATEEAEPSPQWAWCEIEWIHSFRGSEFEARPLAPGTDALARSPRFRWRANEPPPETNADAREAHEELVHVLVSAGWEPVGDGGPWYGERFRRPAESETLEASPERADARPRSARAPVPWARLGIVVLTLGSLAIIIFALLVLLGFFVR